jgi:hypothetical protein
LPKCLRCRNPKGQHCSRFYWIIDGLDGFEDHYQAIEIVRFHKSLIVVTNSPVQSER